MISSNPHFVTKLALLISAPSLGERLSGRRNNIGLLRMVAAGMVLLFHSYALNTLWSRDPLYRVLPGHDLGALGVGVFFFISGLLVTQSYLRSRSLISYVVARALRIYPALLAAVIFSVILAWCSSSLSFLEFFGSEEVQDYLSRAGTGMTTNGRFGSAYVDNPFPFAINGSLWTLPLELRFYWVVALLGLATILVRPTWLLGVVCVLAIWICVAPPDLTFGFDSGLVRALALLFALGALSGVWSQRVRLSIPIAFAAVALVFVFPAAAATTAPYCVALGYVTLVLAYHPGLSLPDFFRDHDYSYGLYVYAFPIQQTVISSGGSFGREPISLFLISLPLVLAVAAASWHFLERPALALKRVVHR